MTPYLLAVMLLFTSSVFAQSGEDDILQEDIININTVSDLQKLEGIPRINGSLFIHAGDNINSQNLCYISSLREIGGYLVIWKSPGITSLKCIRNLEKVEGNELHFGNPPNAILMEDNLNENSGDGLCVSSINWTKLTSYPVTIKDNSNNCPACDSQCIGCWGAGPRLCQTCQNYLSGITCVETCPYGTILNDTLKICQENVTDSLSSPDVIVLDEHNINVSWNATSEANGVILGYRINVNGTIEHTEQYTDYLPESNGLVESSPLKEAIILGGLTSNTQYSICFEVLTSIGWSDCSQTVNIKTHDGIPSPPYDLNVINVTAKNTTLIWNPSDVPLGVIQSYNITVDIFQNNEWVFNQMLIVDVNYTNVTLDNLKRDTEYRFYVIAVNRNYPSPNSSIFTWRTLNDIPNPVTNLTITELTYDSVTISWVSDNNEFDLRLASHSWMDEVTVTNGTYYWFDKLFANTTYLLTVISVNNIGPSSIVSLNFTTNATNPPEPKIPEVTGITDSNMKLSFNSVSDINGWVDYYTLVVEKVDLAPQISYTTVIIPRFTGVYSIQMSDVMSPEHGLFYRFRLVAHVDNFNTTSMDSQYYELKATSSEPSNNNNGWPTWLILVVSFGGTLFIVLIILIVIYRINKKRDKQRRNAVSSVHNPNFDTKRQSSVAPSVGNPMYGESGRPRAFTVTQPHYSEIAINPKRDSAVHNPVYSGDISHQRVNPVYEDRMFTDEYITVETGKAQRGRQYETLPDGRQRDVESGSIFGFPVYSEIEPAGYNRDTNGYDHMESSEPLYGERSYSQLAAAVPELSPMNMLSSDSRL